MTRPVVPTVQRPFKILLAGDSTVATCPATELPMSGWGPHLGAAVNARVNAATTAYVGIGTPVIIDVINGARDGATTESHRDEGLWSALVMTGRPGDLILLQFGHNDQKQPQLAAATGFAANLRTMVAEAREAGLEPVLCTPVARRRFDGDRVIDTHGDHVRVVRLLADELAVPGIDLAAMTADLYERFGPQRSRDLFTHIEPAGHPLWKSGASDDTHFSSYGAALVADLVAERLAPMIIERLSRAATDHHEPEVARS